MNKKNFTMAAVAAGICLLCGWNATAQLPTPLISLGFNENSGSSVANAGSASATFSKTSPPSWSTNVPVNGGVSSVDFGTTTGNYYVESGAVISQLAGLTSFTVTGWVNNRNSTIGAGGNRIVSWINNGGNGVDIVYASGGTLKVGINQWPDSSTAISSAGMIPTDAAASASNWRFFAVTYESSTSSLKFYFGDNTTPASLDQTIAYNRGLVGANIGKLAVGHFNAESSRTTRTDRMFRGLIDQVQIFGTVLSLSEIRTAQNLGGATGPVFTSVTQSGGDLVLQGADGPANGAYEMLRSTDLNVPVTNWQGVGIRSFDGNGNFSFTDPIVPGDPAAFYRLHVISDQSVPEIISQPQDRGAVVGGSTSFSVTAKGLEPLYYQWYYNTNTVLIGETNTTLSLSNVQLTDAGKYSVTVTNLLGTTNSVLATLTVVTNNNAVAVPDGFATQNGGTTGGGNATPITVTTAAAFLSAVNNDNPAVIIVSGLLNVGTVRIGSNKTIIGADTNSGLYGGVVQVQGVNCIFQNLTIGPSPSDAMEVSGASNVFIHKCTFHDSSDELCSIVREADYVTVSWCKFYFDNSVSHSFASLIGNSDTATADRGKLHVTMHHNWYAAGVVGRIPRVRFGQVHLYNNYVNSVGTGYCIGIGVECHIRVERVHFDGVANCWADYGGTSSGEIGWAELKFTNGSTQPTFMPNVYSTIFTLPYPYTLDPVDNVKAIVTAGAGNVLP